MNVKINGKTYEITSFHMTIRADSRRLGYSFFGHDFSKDLKGQSFKFEVLHGDSLAYIGSGEVTIITNFYMSILAS